MSHYAEMRKRDPSEMADRPFLLMAYRRFFPGDGIHQACIGVVGRLAMGNGDNFLGWAGNVVYFHRHADLYKKIGGHIGRRAWRSVGIFVRGVSLTACLCVF